MFFGKGSGRMTYRATRGGAVLSISEEKSVAEERVSSSSGEIGIPAAGQIASRSKRSLRRRMSSSNCVNNFFDGVGSSRSSTEPRQRRREFLCASKCGKIAEEMREAKEMPDVLPLPLPPPPVLSGGALRQTARQSRKWEVYQSFYGIVKILNADWSAMHAPLEVQGPD